METTLCPRCGENLVQNGDQLNCPYCGGSYSVPKQGDPMEALQNAFDAAKMERLANARRFLWSCTHEAYPSKEKVVDAAKDVLSLNAEEFLANVYLHSHDRDPSSLTMLLAESKVSGSEATEAFRWLLPSLSPRLVGPLHDFVDRHFQGKEKTERITQIE